MNRIGLSFACGAVLMSAAGAYAQQAAQPPSKASTNASSKSVTRTPGSSTVAVRPADNGANAAHSGGASRLLQSLEGEWEGQVQVRGSDGMNSASNISASNRLEDNGRSLASCLTGFAFAKPFDGAAVIHLNNSQFSGSWADSLTSTPITASAGAAGIAATSATLAGSMTRESKPFKVEQTFTMSDNNHYIFELHSISAEGRRVLMVRLDMNRLPNGRLAEAHARFTDAPLLGSLRSAAAKNAQASVSTDQ